MWVLWCLLSSLQSSPPLRTLCRDLDHTVKTTTTPIMDHLKALVLEFESGQKELQKLRGDNESLRNQNEQFRQADARDAKELADLRAMNDDLRTANGDLRAENDDLRSDVMDMCAHDDRATQQKMRALQKCLKRVVEVEENGISKRRILSEKWDTE